MKTDEPSRSGGLILKSLEDMREKSPEFPWVSEPDLCETLGILGPSVRKEIYDLRQMGFNVESAMFSDPASFMVGARGWRLVDSEASDNRIDAIYARVDVLNNDDGHPVRWRKGMRLYHPVYGRGKLLFARDGFDKVKLLFGQEEVKLSRNEVYTSHQAALSVDSNKLVG
jgi:hypothetical protein